MPNAIAPSAPCVEVWLSPHAIVIPGCVNPSSGPITCTMPWFSLSGAHSLMPALEAIALEGAHHLFRHHVEERPLLRAGRHDVIDGRERALGKRDRPAVLPHHVERLRRRHLMDQVQADEQLCLAARQRAHRVQRPRPSETVWQPYGSFDAGSSERASLEYTDG